MEMSTPFLRAALSLLLFVALYASSLDHAAPVSEFLVNQSFEVLRTHESGNRALLLHLAPELVGFNDLPDLVGKAIDHLRRRLCWYEDAEPGGPLIAWQAGLR